MIKLQLASVRLDHIFDSHHWDIHPFLHRDIAAELIHSIKIHGILQPPLLYEQDAGSYDIITGRRRISVVKDILNLSEQPCFIISKSSSPQEILSFLFESHCLSSPLSPMEKACLFRIGLQFLAPKKLVTLFSSERFGEVNISTINKHLQLLALEQEIQLLVHDLLIPERIAQDLLKITPVDRLAVIALFQDFQLGGGKQNRLLSLLRDICMRQNISYSTLLAEHEIKEILEHRRMNNPQKIQTLFSLLQQMACPTSQEDEDNFRFQLNQLNLPPYCQVQHSPAFESDEVSLTIHFPNLKQFQNIWPDFATVLRKAQFKNGNQEGQ